MNDSPATGSTAAASGGLGGAITVIGMAVAAHFGIVPTGEVIASVTVIISSLIHYLMLGVMASNGRNNGN